MKIKRIDSAGISDIVDALQSNLASVDDDQMPDFETAYSQLAAGCNPCVNLNELEVRAIRAIIIELQQQLDAVQLKASNLSLVDESDCVRKLRRRLLEQETKIVESQNTHRRLVSALWRFPTEILSLIFVYCLPKDKFLSPEPLLAPMLLTTVCRRWREVAVDMPSLWCRLSVGKTWQQPAFRYESWLKRSRGCPLSLALYSRNNRCTMPRLRSLLQPYIHQVSSLALYCDPDVGVGLPSITDFIALEELTIFTYSCNPMLDIAYSTSHSPSTLRSLTISFPRFGLRSLSAVRPALWARLTSVQITVDQPHTIRHLLYLCPDLSSLSVDIYVNGMQILEPFTHTKLQSLHIISGAFNCGVIGDLSCGIFSAVSLPDLRVLKVHTHNVQYWPHEKFKAFLTRSNCPLESLILGRAVKTTDEQRAEYVSLIPSLVVDRYL